MVVALRFVGTGASDREDGDAAPVRAAHLDASEFGAPDEAEGPKKQVVGLKHLALPGLREERWVSLLADRGEPGSPLVSGWRREVCQDRTRRRPAFRFENRLGRKRCQEGFCFDVPGPGGG